MRFENIKLARSFCDREYPSPEAAGDLTGAFSWTDTPEGYDYWLVICEKIRDGGISMNEFFEARSFVRSMLSELESEDLERPFYVVFNRDRKDGNMPTYQHETLGEAMLEADRLANVHQGNRFVVMAPVRHYVAVGTEKKGYKPVTAQILAEADDFMSDIPF